MSLFVVEIFHQDTPDHVINPSPSSSQMEEEDILGLPTWVVALSCSHDFLDDIFSLNEAILEAMNGQEQPWEELHHRSYFLLELE